MSDTFDVIHTFVDDEPVDPAALERALADPAGRSEFIELIMLRNLARQSVPAMPARAAAAASGPGRVRAITWLPAAAVLAIVAGLSGYVAGGRAKPETTAPAIDTVVTSGGESTAPAPAYIIRLEPGVDWTERSGGR